MAARKSGSAKTQANEQLGEICAVVESIDDQLKEVRHNQARLENL